MVEAVKVLVPRTAGMEEIYPEEPRPRTVDVIFVAANGKPPFMLEKFRA